MVIASGGSLAHAPTPCTLTRMRTRMCTCACRRTVISGGGSLATHLDDFFEVIGLPVLNGWGLTETSPVLACRRVDQVRVLLCWRMEHTPAVLQGPGALQFCYVGQCLLLTDVRLLSQSYSTSARTH